MANEKVTSLEVAALAGVSQSAVSRAFTPGSSIAEETKFKVTVAARKLSTSIKVMPGRDPNQLLKVLEALAAITGFPTAEFAQMLSAESSRLSSSTRAAPPGRMA